MAFNGLKKAVTLTPSVRTLPSGVPAAPLLNLAARAPADPHAHGHGVAPRSDAPPRWTGGVLRSSAGMVSKSYVTRELSARPQPSFV